MKIIVKIMSIVVYFMFFSCTENPLFKDNKMTGNVIKGQVILEGQSSAHNAYVWLEGFQTGTFSENDGHFQLDLSTSKQGGGLVGKYNLYFYVNNYALDSASVVINNGNIQPDAGDLDNTYNLRKKITLLKKLDIDVQISPQSVSRSFNDSLKMTVTLKAYQDTVRVATKIKDAVDLTAAFIKQKDEKNIQIIDFGGSIYTQIPVLKQYLNANFKRQFFMSIPFNASNYSSGEYEIIPYILVTPTDVPSGLLSSLLKNWAEINTGFVNIPMVRFGGFVQIR